MRLATGNGDLQPVVEFYTSYDLGQLLWPIEPAPTFLGSFDQLEDERQRRLIRQAAFGANGSMAHGEAVCKNVNGSMAHGEAVCRLTRYVSEGADERSKVG